MDIDIVLVGLEGGPNAGKTKIKQYLVERLMQEHGILAFATPEAVTEVREMGFDFRKNTELRSIVSKMAIRRMRDNEDFCTALARHHVPEYARVVVFCDRSTPGLRGYMGGETVP